MDTYSEVHILTKVHGEPTYETLNDLKNKLKRNACSVTSDLGRGTHSHFGIVLTAVEYAAISPDPYVHPAYPSNLTIATGTAQHEATRLLTVHE